MKAAFLFFATLFGFLGANAQTSPTTQPNTMAVKNHLDSISHHAKELSHIGKHEEAIVYGNQAEALSLQLYGEKSAEHAQSLSDLAGYYSHNGNYEKALQLGTTAMNIRAEVLGQDNPAYAQSLNNIARYHSYLGNYIEAVITGRKAMLLRADLLGKENADYAQSVSNLAGYQSRLGNYEEALTLGEEARDIREKVLGKEHPDYAQSLNNLSKYHYFLGHTEEAIRLAEQALSLRERLLGKHHPDYATALSNLADYHLKAGNYPQAMKYGEEALAIRKEILGTNHPEYAESVSNMASYHHSLGHHAEAVVYGEEAVALRRQLLGEDHLSYTHSLCKLATYYSANDQSDLAEETAQKATEQYTDAILGTFADLTSHERDLFWMRVKPWFSNTIFQLAAQHPSPKMVNSAYNATLLAKGLLLNSELEMANLLMESGDSALIDSYKRLQYSRAMLTRQREWPKDKRTMNIDSLQRDITKQERHLVKRSKAYGNYTRPLKVKWERIVRQLGQKDLAIEYVCYRSTSGKEQYAAMVISKNQSSPVFVPLASGEQLSKIEAKDLYTTSQLSSLVWKPLAKYLEGARNVYFAPAGELYNIAIESLPHWEDPSTLLMDHWQFYRLSSTREIALSRERKKPALNAAAIYGGVSYDLNASKDERHKTKRKGAKYLPGTKKEAVEIGHTISGHDITTTTHLNTEATENSFKHLSGHAPTIIHIATHGFYWTDSEVRDGSMDEKLSFLSMYGNLDDADKAMTRSGLLLAGANEALTGLMHYRHADDGILTAKEISMLDLRGVDLLVLSACQTGLGRITGDGVFGLQRGFKKAGANAILMSLWKVDDGATRILMTHFYDYLMQGYGKHESLRRAQKDMQTMEVKDPPRRKRAITSRAKRARHAKSLKKYADPYYWAAFILLDGI